MRPSYSACKFADIEKHSISPIVRYHARLNSVWSEMKGPVPAGACLGPSVSDLESCGPLRRSVSVCVMVPAWALFPYPAAFLQKIPGVLFHPACALATFQTAAVALAGPNDGNR